MIITTVLLAFVVQAVAVLIVTSGGDPMGSLAVTTDENILKVTTPESPLPLQTSVTPTAPKFVPSPLITIAPLSRNPLELRQRCFDDRGFSVDCATWTGYYYTWGGAGHPYAGGPGEGGGGSESGNSGSSNGAGSIFIGEVTRLRVMLISVIVCLTVSLATMLL